MSGAAYMVVKRAFDESCERLKASRESGYVGTPDTPSRFDRIAGLIYLGGAILIVLAALAATIGVIATTQ